MVYTVDVSPDNKYLAVAGWFGKDDEAEDLGDIRIYDYKTGFLKKQLKFHEDVVKSLKFSDDSNWLISGDASGFIIKWDYLLGAPFLYDRMAFGFSNLDTHLEYFVTTHEDGMIYKWDYNKTKPVKKINFFQKTKERVVTPEVTISKGGEHIAISGKEIGMVLIFDEKFSMQDYFFIDNFQIIDMAFSPSGNRLLLGLKNPGKKILQWFSSCKERNGQILPPIKITTT